MNADLMQRAVIDTTAMTWQPSPSGGVWRKRLELIGSVEAGRVTSIVRYEAGSAFPAHKHPEGEEILVLEGTFSDEFGDHAAGSYLLNPDGSGHAPFANQGCIIFVKLRQYAGTNRKQVAIDTNTLPWISGATGLEFKLLYAQSGYAEQMRLERWRPETRLETHSHLNGEEILVLQGEFADEYGEYSAGTWLRNPPHSSHTPFSRQGCLLYVKTRHIKTDFIREK